jgi:hypothetical protein
MKMKSVSSYVTEKPEFKLVPARAPVDVIEESKVAAKRLNLKYSEYVTAALRMANESARKTS